MQTGEFTHTLQKHHRALKVLELLEVKSLLKAD